MGMNHRLVHFARGAAFASALAACALPATAAIYSSTFDPPDFSGIATFDVADACLVSDGFQANDGSPCAVTWLSAIVTLHQTPPGSTRIFDYSGFLPSPTAVSQIFVQSGQLSGVDSSIIGPVVLAGDSEPEFNGPFWLQYSISNSPGEFGLGIVNLFTGTCTFDVALICTLEDDPSVASVLTFTRVPEPATLLLLVGALALAPAVMRKRRRAA